MRTRRATLAAFAGAGGVALAGCLFSDDSLEASAEPAAVDETAVDDTGFEHEGLTERTHEETVEAAGESQSLRLTNWTSQYVIAVPAVDLDGARVSLFTTPTVTVAGRSANPFGRLDRERLLAAMVEALGTGIEDVERVGGREVTVLGRSVTVDEFEARTEPGGIDLRLHLGDRTHEGDLLVAVGLHPERLELTGDVDTLLGGTVHPAERPP